MAERFPSWKQALLTFFGGVVLAGTGCFGFLLSLGSNFERGGNAVFTPIAAIAFGIGLLTILVGFVFAIMRTVRAMVEKGQPTAGPPVGGPPVGGAPTGGGQEPGAPS